jgi:hypothetical protein
VPVKAVRSDRRERERLRERSVTRRAALAAVLGLAVSLRPSARAAVPEVDMADVRRLAREPVETIFSGAPVGRVSDADYWKTVRGSPKPVVVVFYANQDERSRNLATLVRYLTLEFGEVVGFYGYRVTAGATVERDALAAVQKRYGIKKVPAFLFYDNDRGKMELERTDYSTPALLEYRTPSLLFWKTYHQAIREYIRKNILD